MKLPIITTEHFITLEQIFAAVFEKFSTTAKQMEVKSNPYAYSDTLHEITVTPAVSEILKSNQFEIPPRDDGILTLSDRHPDSTKASPGWAPSNYWNFKLKDEDSKIAVKPILSFILMVVPQEKKRGVLCMPHFFSNLLSPADMNPHLRMCNILGSDSQFRDSCGIMTLLNECEGKMLIPWGDIGFSGIRSVHALQKEFLEDKSEELKMLIHSHRSPLDPCPFEVGGGCVKAFVKECDQYALLEQWRLQIEEYRQKLAA